jgi:hypothetical protein
MRIARATAAVVCTLALAWGGAGVAAAASASNTPNLSCGEVISASVTLTGNLHCSGNGLIIDADDNVTLDLGGHSVTGNGTGDGIVMSSSDVPDFNYTVQNGRVSDFGSCVYAANASVADVIGMTITACPTAVELAPYLTDYGLADSRITDATNDLLYDPDETSDIVFIDVTGSTIIGGAQQVITSFGEGYYNDDHITDSPVTFDTPGNDAISNNVFNNSTIYENTFGNAVQISDNTIENAPTGLVDYSFGGDTITGNTFKHDGLGAGIYRSFGTGFTIGETITENRFIDNGASGLYVDASGSLDGTISSNTATGNGFLPNGQQDSSGHPLTDGITIDQNGNSFTLADNKTKDNAGYGIWLDQNGSVTDGGGNTSHGNPQGCSPFNLCTY